MCGFSGWVLNTPTNTEKIVASLRSIKHRGPDDTLIVSNTPTASLYSCTLSNAYSQTSHPPISNQLSKTCFGFNRLSIVDLSDNAMQPFLDKKQNILFMMNGEIYNYAELRSEYLSDEVFLSNSDSEVAFKLYKKLGNSFVHKLKGMFAIVVYDYTTQTLKVWRDRLGIKPFYYTITKQGIVFSSEMKGIFATEIKTKELDYNGLAYSMYLGTCPSPLSIYKDILSLQPGHFLEFNNSTQEVTIQAYWHLKYTPNHQTIDENAFSKDVEDICKLYATGDVKKALMLSGGLDSGTLAYFYGKQNDAPEAVHIYTNKPDSEHDFAQLNAQNAGINIANFEISPTFSDAEINLFLKSEEEPNALPEPALVLCDKVKGKNIKVLYNALGPDELFGGYGYYQTIHQFLKKTYLFRLPIFLYPKKQRQKIQEIRTFSLAAFPFIARQLFSWKEITQLLKENNQPIPEHPISFINKQIIQLYPEFTQLPTLKKASYYDIFYYISSHHTFRSDQPSMLYGIEMRFPFLEHTFIEKYFNQVTTFDEIAKNLKPNFRNYVKSLLSPKVLNMKKQGFSIAIDQMLPANSASTSHQQWYLLMLKTIFPRITKSNER